MCDDMGRRGWWYFGAFMKHQHLGMSLRGLKTILSIQQLLHHLIFIITPGAVLGVCMCHPGSQESLQDWLSALQETYPTLAKATIVYNISKTEPSPSSDSSLQLPPHRTRLSSRDLGSIEERVSDVSS